MLMEKLTNKEKRKDTRGRKANVTDKMKFLRKKKEIIGMSIIYEGTK